MEKTNTKSSKTVSTFYHELFDASPQLKWDVNVELVPLCILLCSNAAWFSAKALASDKLHFLSTLVFLLH